jgi:thioredoxin-dependent peroxiredoxin
MLRSTKIAAGLLILALGIPMLSWGTTLKVGDKAPDFTLPDQNGHEISLSQLLGKNNVVLAFYVLAFTGG